MHTLLRPRLALILLCSTLIAVPLRAQAPVANEPIPEEKAWAKAASNSLLPMLAAGELVLLSDNRDGKRLATRGVGALATTYVATSLLKRAFGQKRRTRADRDSFPSGHASLSFAMAATLGSYKPNYAAGAYGAATTIAVSRVELREHRWRDVVAGAALGFAIGRAWSRRDAGQVRAHTPAVSVAFKW